MAAPEDALHALHAQIERTRARLESLERSFDQIVSYSEGTPPDDEHDPEGATVGWERAQLSALRDQALEHLRQLEDAQVRLERGTYGRCERCAGAVEPQRLEARPATQLCVACAALP